MKKVLAFVLTLAMVLGCFASVFAADFTDVKADDAFATAVDVLSDLGVVSGYTDGSYQPTKVVTRAEMASLLVKALGLKPSAATTTKFTDVEPTDWFAGWVAYANSLGIIAGRTETTFDPKAPVSYDEAIVMIINALGYSGSLTGTYPTAFIIKAQSLGITKNVDLLGTTGANRGDIAQLIYNTLGKSIGTTNKDGEWKANPDDDTMFTRLGAHKGAELLVTPAIIAAASADLTEYLGAKIIPVYNDDDEVIAVDSSKTTFVEGKVTVKNGVTKIGDEVVESGLNLTSGAALYLNGAKTTAAPSETELKATSYKYAVKYNDDDEINEIVSIQWWKGETPFQATADVKADALKLGDYDLPRMKNDEKTVDTEAFELLGVDTIGDIKEGNVITVYKAGSDVVKVEVGTTVVTGTVSASTADTITVNGTKYDFTSMTGALVKDSKKSADYFFDYAGTLQFSAWTDNTSDEQYAVVLEANYESNGSGWSGSTATITRQVKLLLTTGEEVVYDVYNDTDLGEHAVDALMFDGAVAGTGVTKAAKTWADGLAQTIVTFTLKDGALYEVTPATQKAVASSTEKVSAKSSVDGFYFADGAVAFVWDGDDEEYTVVTEDKLASMALASGAYFVVDENGRIAVLYSGAATADVDAVYGILASEDWSKDESTSVYTISFFVDGKATDYTTKKDPTTFTTGVFQKLLFTGEYVSSTTDAAIEKTAKIGGTVTGNTYKDTDNESFGIDANAFFYIVDTADDNAVTVGTITDLESDKNTKIFMYDTSSTADALYDAVVIYR